MVTDVLGLLKQLRRIVPVIAVGSYALAEASGRLWAEAASL